MNLPKTELTNEKIDEILELLHNDWLEDDYDPTDCGAMEAKRDLASLIHQAEIKARIDELIKLKKAHSIAIFDEYLENHIQALEKEIV